MSAPDDDLSIAGPGSPVSLAKFIRTTPKRQPFTVIVDGDRQGIINDAENVITMSAEDCYEQARWYAEKFNGRQIPIDLMRDLLYFYHRDAIPDLSREGVLAAVKSGDLTETSPVYLECCNRIRYAASNRSVAQIIGLTMLTRGVLHDGSKTGRGVSIYYEHPESHLHPKDQSALMMWFNQTYAEYGRRITADELDLEDEEDEYEEDEPDDDESQD